MGKKHKQKKTGQKKKKSVNSRGGRSSCETKSVPVSPDLSENELSSPVLQNQEPSASFNGKLVPVNQKTSFSGHIRRGVDAILEHLHIRASPNGKKKNKMGLSAESINESVEQEDDIKSIASSYRTANCGERSPESTKFDSFTSLSSVGTPSPCAQGTRSLSKSAKKRLRQKRKKQERASCFMTPTAIRCISPSQRAHFLEMQKRTPGPAKYLNFNESPGASSSPGSKFLSVSDLLADFSSPDTNSAQKAVDLQLINDFIESKADYLHRVCHRRDLMVIGLADAMAMSSSSDDPQLKAQIARFLTCEEKDNLQGDSQDPRSGLDYLWTLMNNSAGHHSDVLDFLEVLISHGPSTTDEWKELKEVVQLSQTPKSPSNCGIPTKSPGSHVSRRDAYVPVSPLAVDAKSAPTTTEDEKGSNSPTPSDPEHVSQEDGKDLVTAKQTDSLCLETNAPLPPIKPRPRSRSRCRGSYQALIPPNERRKTDIPVPSLPVRKAVLNRDSLPPFPAPPKALLPSSPSTSVSSLTVSLKTSSTKTSSDTCLLSGTKKLGRILSLAAADFPVRQLEFENGETVEDPVNATTEASMAKSTDAQPTTTVFRKRSAPIRVLPTIPPAPPPPPPDLCSSRRESIVAPPAKPATSSAPPAPPPPPADLCLSSRATSMRTAAPASSAPPAPPPPPPGFCSSRRESLAPAAIPGANGPPAPPPPPPGLCSSRRESLAPAAIPGANGPPAPPPPPPGLCSSHREVPVAPPPPPANLLGGGPPAPPPPPPPVGGKNEASSPLIRAGVVKSEELYPKKKKTYTVLWDTVNHYAIQNANTVWNEYTKPEFAAEDREEVLLRNEVERIFERVQPQPKPSQKKEDKKEELAGPQLDGRRAMALEILLAKLRPLSVVDLSEKLEKNETEELSLDLLQGLIKHYPSEDEMSMFLDVDRSLIKRKCEELCWEAARRPNMRLRAELAVARATVPQELKDQLSVVSSLKLACETVRTDIVVQLLHKCLQTGNFLNQGTALSRAAGFKLKSLPEFLNMKGKGENSAYRCVDVLAKFMEVDMDKAQEAIDNLAVFRSSKICDVELSSTESARTIGRLKQQLERCHDEGMLETYAAFMQEVEESCSNLTRGVTDLREMEAEIKKYFCGSDKDTIEEMGFIIADALQLLVQAKKKLAASQTRRRSNSAREVRPSSSTLSAASSSLRSRRFLGPKRLSAEEMSQMFLDAQANNQ